ncbi:mobilization protein [Campylobacter sp. MIT 97-5078]|uniref:mobilization protein n=1 Tax=Campylobacter sp. MIT 97-5078 TaxID=1548153 RepID=UPI000A3F1571|nr:mobilization protein [Campylobacter sp. MIT 97-5078]
MSNLSSINFKKSIKWQIWHNSSERADYAIGGELICSCDGYEALKLKNQIIENAKEQYAKHTGQKFQAKSYEWSAVVNIKPNTTMHDLERLAEHFNSKYGFQCYQIAIHRDEGHINENGEKVINHHAHLEFITLDKKTGKNMYRRELISPRVLRQIQTEVAEILQMQRGQDKRITKRQRIEPRKYAQIKEQEKRERKQLLEQIRQEHEANQAQIKYEYTQEIEALRTENTKEELLAAKEVKAEIEAFRKACIGKGYPKDFFRELGELKKTAKETLSNDLNNTLEALTQAYTRQNQELTEEKTKSKTLDEQIKALEAELKALKAKEEELIEEKTEREKIKNNFIRTCIKTLYTNDENEEEFEKSFPIRKDILENTIKKPTKETIECLFNINMNKSLSDKNKTQKIELEELKAKNEALEKACNELEANLSALQKIKEENKQLKTENETLKTQINTLINEQKRPLNIKKEKNEDLYEKTQKNDLNHSYEPKNIKQQNKDFSR